MKPQPHFIERLKKGARQDAARRGWTRGESQWPKTGVACDHTITVAYYPACNRYTFWLRGLITTQADLIAFLEAP